MESTAPEHWVNSLGMKFNLVTPGEFLMGSPETEVRRFADETLRKVTLTRRFYMSVFLTTQAEWRAVTGENPSKHSLNKRAPVDSVNWYDCAGFIEKLNADEYLHEITNYLGDHWRYAFPTEAQWEYCCRANTRTPYYFGTSVKGAEGLCALQTGESGKSKSDRIGRVSTTTEVGQFPANPWGFYDMFGNLCEWTFDYYSDYDSTKLIDPVCEVVSAEKVARGGSWNSPPENCRSASRFNFLSTYRGSNCGLRIAIVELQ